MAVLVEGISVVVLRSAIAAYYPGGVSGFVTNAPNRTLCADDTVVRVGFMSPADVHDFVERLGRLGFIFQRDGSAADIVVVDQREGPTTPCRWLVFECVDLGTGGTVGTARHVESKDESIAFPDGWTFEQSLSKTYGFVPLGKTRRLRFIRRDANLEIYEDLETGKTVYIGRTMGLDVQ